MGSQQDGSVRFRFRREMRLLRPAEFDRVFREGRSASGRNVTVHVVANELGRARLGMAVVRAVGGAVARNRIRRLIREAFRLRQHDLPAGCDIVAVPRRSWSAPGTHRLGDELVALVRQALRESR